MHVPYGGPWEYSCHWEMPPAANLLLLPLLVFLVVPTEQSGPTAAGPGDTLSGCFPGDARSRAPLTFLEQTGVLSGPFTGRGLKSYAGQGRTWGPSLKPRQHAVSLMVFQPLPPPSPLLLIALFLTLSPFFLISILATLIFSLSLFLSPLSCSLFCLIFSLYYLLVDSDFLSQFSPTSLYPLCLFLPLALSNTVFILSFSISY